MMQNSGILVLLIVIGVGIMGVMADESLIPNLVGNWTCTSEGFHSEPGYFHAGDYQYILNIGQQEGRIFNGTLIVSGLDPTREYPFSGVVAHDMKTLHIAEYGTGQDYGYLLSPDQMELVLLVDETDNFSVLCNLTKEGS
ncbi:hypothetical protein [Methanospirillum lacunae]|uniref:TIGR03067 domain-containing protein n=1 Tax=Methanospirillum lacunae TaxID=668570 RepID=A0A2V2NEE7_9EURY|nr:hypothetical protein [Methanospirillum lacunae]PWR73693.1 hypothetical protein DK846_00535 [Methanospirillum lacunae]